MLALVAGTIACVLQTATGPPALALDRWIELTNNTRMPIVEVYISPVRSELWKIRRNVDICAVERFAVSYR